MISILIPTYNTDISKLVSNLYKQGTNCGIDFEIISLDDGSANEFKNQQKDNARILNYYKAEFNSKNIGRTETRQKLAELATYNWIVFLDADVIPGNKNFIQNYINAIKKNNFDLCVGGLIYKNKKPENDKILRWTYGRKKEMINAHKRSKKPYKIITSANLMIRKEIFLKINRSLSGNFYGYDNIFSIKLKASNYKVLHIDNAVYHIGLETNDKYLQKKEMAARTIHLFYHQGLLNSGDNNLLKTYKIIDFQQIDESKVPSLS